ncbi:accessory Sec system protein translocase subunit SecY2 [Hutsoniella sourekii]|uniref:accessory Sec system protein translocase subunit SecY2 n=1 Tax=Hutsoniella sourekii TaxID=87650 RepID=UPI000484A7AD|nr:accessory Sec system protein translocase subunit SecY2 [Hutsoniella sourekii]
MISELSKSYSFRVISRKSLFTLGILMIYILGRNIPLPFVGQQAIPRQEMNNFMSYAMMAAGGDASTRSLVTLGVGPYMSTMMIWRFVSMSDWFKRKKLSMEQSGRLQNLLTLVIGLIQAMGIVASYQLGQVTRAGIIGSINWMQALLVLFLLAGSLFTIWLGFQNSKHGFGQFTVFICISIISRYAFSPEIYRDYFSSIASSQEIRVLLILGLLAVISFMGTIIFELAELRIPLNRIMIDSEYNEKNYLPIKLNPSGGMAIMYAMTFLALPQYLLAAIELVIGPKDWIQATRSSLEMTSWTGVLLYLGTLFGLSILMAFVNVNPSELTDQLKRSGDYILGIRPGRPTEYFLSRQVLRLSLIGAVFLTIVAGGPMLFGVIYPEYQQILFLPGSISIVGGIMISVVLEMRAYYQRGQYGPLL